MGIQEVTWGNGILRSVFSFLDGIVYSVIQWIMYGIFDLSKITGNTDIFNGIYVRIYIILGIFMAFKLSFSFFQYIVDPDSMGGKSEKGVGKLLTRVFLMLGALILLPGLLFGGNGEKGLLPTAQEKLLPVLPRLIFGSDGFRNTDNAVEDSSEEITLALMNGFVTLHEDELKKECNISPGQYKPIEKKEDFKKVLDLKCGGYFGRKYYVYTYHGFFSTVTGVLTIILLLGITLSIAKRIFKLIILELIAPIPIMSLIDPKGAKDGAFAKWLGNLISTFVDIFVKLGLVYIMIVLIQQIADSKMFENFDGSNGFLRTAYLKLFLILGLLFFAKEAPKFIKDSLGIKDSGGGLFDDVKTTLGIGAGVAGISGAALASGKASYLADETNGKGHGILNRAKNIAAGIAGAGAGAVTAGGALMGKNAGPGAVSKALRERNAATIAAGAAGSTFLGRAIAGAERTFRGETTADVMGREIAMLESRASAGEALHSYLEDRAVKKGYGYKVSAVRDDKTTKISTTYDEFATALSQAKQKGESSFSIDGETFYTYSSETARIEGDLKTAAANEWAKDELKKDIKDRDSTFEDFRTAYLDSGGQAANITDAGALKGAFKTDQRQAKNKKASSKYNKYKADAGNSKK